jgi:hypothetical protein
MHSVIETYGYLSDAKKTNIDEGERKQIVDFLAARPTAGDVIPGSGGARKLRFSGRGKGKSGGYRVITFYGGDDIPIFLIAVFAKGDRVNLSQAERNELREELAGLAEDYRQGEHHDVTGRRTYPS